MIRKCVYAFIMLLIAYCHVQHTKDQQLCMFIHQHDTLTDEEGMNVAHQFLTACIQKACPVLISQSLWNHVLNRKKRFDMHVYTNTSIQSKIVQLHEITNTMIQKYSKNIEKLNQLLDITWFNKNFSDLAKLDKDTVTVLLFDYFCSKLHEVLHGWNIYILPEGYILGIPQKNTHHHFCIDGLKSFDIYNSEQKIKYYHASLSTVLRKYICLDDTEWSFYLTGHGYHQGEEHAQASIAGMSVTEFQKTLLTLNSRFMKTKMLVYSSCYSAGEHSIVPYQYNDKDMLLKYPIIMISCVDAPTYVFGVPAGLRLPPYHKDNILMKSDLALQKLQWHVMQNYQDFVEQAKRGNIGRKLAYSVSPYVHCLQNICDITKVENLPLIRKAGQLHFMPLDESLACMVQQQSKNHIEVADKSVVMFYTKRYSGVLSIKNKLPICVSMLPGNQVHCISKLEAKQYNFKELVTSCFMAVDDEHEQNIYLFDKICCKSNDTFDTQYETLSNVVIIPAGSWTPKFVINEASLYVYAQIKGKSYWFSFDHNKHIIDTVMLHDKHIDIMYQFINLLRKQCDFGSNFSMKQLLSADHFVKQSQLSDTLLQQCLQNLICKDLE